MFMGGLQIAMACMSIEHAREALCSEPACRGRGFPHHRRGVQCADRVIPPLPADSAVRLHRGGVSPGRRLHPPPRHPEPRLLVCQPRSL